MPQTKRTSPSSRVMKIMSVTLAAIVLSVTHSLFVQAQSRSITIYLAGDSTMAQKLPSKRPETGWREISGGGKQDVDNIARDDAQQEKDDDRDPEQGHEHQCEAPYDISKHLAAPVSVHSAKVDTGCAIGARASHQAGWRGLPWLVVLEVTYPATHPRSDSRYKSCSP